MDKPEHPIEEHHLLSYLSASPDKELVNKVEQWLGQSEENRKSFEAIQKVWTASEGIAAFDKVDVDMNWNAFREKTIGKKQGKAKQVNWFQPVWKVAAAVLAVTVLSYMLYNIMMSPMSGEVKLLADKGQIEQYTLPDGSKVWLNDGSQLTYDDSFGDKVRELDLVGEGFFEVVENTEKAFVVRTNDTETRVLGTSFNLKGNKNTKTVSLVLVSGKVEFSKGNKKEVLHPGERILVGKQGNLIKDVNKDLNFNAWQTRILTFEETSMKEVIAKVSQLYKVNITIEDESFNKCPLTTQFSNESLEEVLQTLQLVFDVQLNQEGENRYRLMGKGCE